MVDMTRNGTRGKIKNKDGREGGREGGRGEVVGGERPKWDMKQGSGTKIGAASFHMTSGDVMKMDGPPRRSA